MTLRIIRRSMYTRFALAGFAMAGFVTVGSAQSEPLPLPLPVPPANTLPMGDGLPPAGDVKPASGVAPVLLPIVVPDKVKEPAFPSVPAASVAAPPKKLETAPRPMLAPMPTVTTELPTMVFPKVETKPSPVVIGVIGTSKEPPPAKVITTPATVPVATVSQSSRVPDPLPQPMAPALKPIIEIPMTAVVIETPPASESPKIPATTITKVPETKVAIETPPASESPKVPTTTLTKAAETKTVSEVKVGKPPVDTLAAYTTMLSEAKLTYSKVLDYTGVVIHQDRLRGKLSTELQAEITVKTKPASVSLRYADPGAIRGLELVFATGRNNGKVRMKPAGTPSNTRLVSVSLNDPQATSHSRHLVTEFGIGPMIEMLEKQLMIEQRVRNTPQVTVADYTYNGKLVTRYDIYTDRAHALRFAYRTVVYVDQETKLPIRMEAYDQPAIGGPVTGDLMEVYSYINLKFNQGVGDERFEK